MSESGELVFWRYAFQVIDCCAHGKVSQQEKNGLIDILRFGGTPSRERIIELYPNAVKPLKSWSEEDIRHYWCEEHNKIVANNPACKVYCFKVYDVLSGQENEECRISIGAGYNFPSYIRLSKDDFFTMHNRVVAEKLSEADVKKYFGCARK